MLMSPTTDLVRCQRPDVLAVKRHCRSFIFANSYCSAPANGLWRNRGPFCLSFAALGRRGCVVRTELWGKTLASAPSATSEIARTRATRGLVAWNSPRPRRASLWLAGLQRHDPSRTHTRSRLPLPVLADISGIKTERHGRRVARQSHGLRHM